MPAVALKEFELSTTSFSRALELGGDSALLRERHVGTMHQYACKLLEQARSANDSAGMTRVQELLDQSFEGRRKLVELEPRHAEWWRDLAYSYTVQVKVDARDHGDQAAQIRNLREALRCREEAVKNQPNCPLLHNERGLTNSSIASALTLQQKPDTKTVAEHSLRSIEGWRKAVELAGYEVTITYQGIESDMKRLVGLSLTDPAIAVKDLMKACSILEPLAGKPLSGQAKPGYIMNALLQLHRGLQGAYEALGLAKEARTEADTIAALEGRETTASGMLALGQTKYYEAHYAWGKARVLPPDQRDAALAKVEAQRLQAHALLEKAFEKESADPKYRDSLANSWRLKGLILQDQNKKREAVVAFDKAVTLYDPVTGLSGIIDTLGDAAGRLDDLKDYKAAVEYSQRAVKLADERCAKLWGPGLHTGSHPCQLLRWSRLEIGSTWLVADSCHGRTVRD